MISAISSFLLWLGVWIMLSWPLDPHDIVLGSIMSIFVTIMTLDIFKSISGPPQNNVRGALPRRAAWFIVYIFVFVWECVKANIDVAYRVLCPSLPIRPGTFRVKTSLKSDIGLTFLTSSITLTPGMTSVDIDEQRGFIYIHFLCVSDPQGRQCPRLHSVARFEKILNRIFE
jgi:multicomponent Na+:H+ antiporter subunit E